MATNMDLKSMVEAEVSHINKFVGSSGIASQGLLETINPDAKKAADRNTSYIENTMKLLDDKISNFKQEDVDYNYNFMFALRRDVKTRFASRSLLMKTGLDNKLYTDVVLQVVYKKYEKESS